MSAGCRLTGSELSRRVALPVTLGGGHDAARGRGATRDNGGSLPLLWLRLLGHSRRRCPVGEGWHDERECLTCGQHFRRVIGERPPRPHQPRHALATRPAAAVRQLGVNPRTAIPLPALRMDRRDLEAQPVVRPPPRPFLKKTRDFVKAKLLRGREPSSVGSVMQHATFVAVTGQLFYDDAQRGGSSAR